MRLDSIARVRLADSLAEVARAARAARRDSLARSSPMLGGAPTGIAPAPRDSIP
jgi:hypothetical protein